MKFACSTPQGSTENDAKSNFLRNIYSEQVLTPYSRGACTKKWTLNCIRLKHRTDWWDSGQIQIITAHWQMGHSPFKYVEDVWLIIKRNIHTCGGEARNMTENALSILIVFFLYNSNKLRPQTESCVFSLHYELMFFFLLSCMLQSSY